MNINHIVVQDTCKHDNAGVIKLKRLTMKFLLCKRRYTTVILPLIMALNMAPGEAEAQIRITKPAGEKTSIDLAGMTVSSDPASREFQRTLQNNLSRSGWFTIGRPGASEVRVMGSVQQRRGALVVECRVLAAASGRSFMSQSYDRSAEEARRLAHRVADDIVEAVTGHKGIASTRIVMVGTPTGHKELYISDADGGNIIQLTNDEAISVRPRWSPDGKQIVYTGYLQRFPDIFRIDLPTGRREVVANFPGLNTAAAISPDGRDVALILSKDGNPELYIRNLRSGRLTRLTNTPNAAEASPSWSPDGRRIVYVSDQTGRPQLYIISRDGGRPERLTSRGRVNVAPDWGPNGLITYSSFIDGTYHVCVIDPETREVRQISSGATDWDDPSWAPNGRHIVCSRRQNNRYTLYVLDTMGDPPVRLINESGDWYSPAWSPD